MDRNFVIRYTVEDFGSVVPYVGTWIEIAAKLNTSKQSMVVPYVGTWIEMDR